MGGSSSQSVSINYYWGRGGQPKRRVSLVPLDPLPARVWICEILKYSLSEFVSCVIADIKEIIYVDI